jgi:hypothetical protein
VTAPELSSQGGRARSHGTRDSAGAHLGRKARSEAEKCVAAPEFNSARKTRPEAVGHVVAPEPTSVGRCGSKL